MYAPGAVPEKDEPHAVRIPLQFPKCLREHVVTMGSRFDGRPLPPESTDDDTEGGGTLGPSPRTARYEPPRFMIDEAPGAQSVASTKGGRL
ncbi:hypothetical protein ColLi_05313 [Colletotrichum liriopes]|uniref:Uncharacterized protein n=1 Tax=Colletotrichum liriopes TaxID=708192 RepID=A0AA37GK79_9PEZI|nr:hypothetical protein ColLi_05313 [Colletotrichum liriopes]